MSGETLTASNTPLERLESLERKSGDTFEVSMSMVEAADQPTQV